jgi:N-methylhydantoinase A
MTISVGIDVGGTFTDLILMDDATGAVRLSKVPTTLDNQAFGVLQALANTGVALADVDSIVHGTTTTTNAVLERKLARVGMITTRGFRDTLELGRRTRPTAYGLKGSFTPLIPREWRLEVDERLDAKGDVLTSLNEAQFLVAITELKNSGVEALLIHFLHSYANPVHELRALELAKTVWPNSYITAAHQVISEYREYERGTAGAVNAAVQPILDRYIQRLQNELTKEGFGHDLLVMQGNGGTVGSRSVTRMAVNTVMSGPASGVMAAAHVGRIANILNMITYDMGGTSSDVALIEKGLPKVSSELELEYGMPIHVPMVDVHTVGAGGGSIAKVNTAGILQVGPHSAGARPGPICYSRGGTEPTITDANLLLGRLDSKKLLSVDNPVTIEHVSDLILEKIGAPLGLSAKEGAAAILHVANNNMAGAIRLVSLARGHDPRDFALFAFGGAGPLHATALARELGIPSVLIPARPGLTNALGCLVADVRHDFVKPVNRLLKFLTDTVIADCFDQQVAKGRRMIDKEGIVVTDIEIRHTAEMQFQGQSHLLSVDLLRENATIESLQQEFAKAYWDRFGVELAELLPVLASLNTSVVGKRRVPPLSQLSQAVPAATLADAEVGRRPVWFDGTGWLDTPVYARDRLPDADVSGPAIIEQLDSTIVLEPSNVARHDVSGNLLITI